MNKQYCIFDMDGTYPINSVILFLCFVVLQDNHAYASCSSVEKRNQSKKDLGI